MKIDDLIAELRDLNADHDPTTMIAGFLVASDVFDRLMTSHVIEDAPLEILAHLRIGMTVTKSAMLPPGTIIPVNAEGIPLLKPRTKTSKE